MIKALWLLVIGAVTAVIALPASAETTPGGTFYDDDTSVHSPAIEAIAAEGITRGCNPPFNTRFCPARAVTRGEMAAFLSRALQLPDIEATEFTDTGSTVFADDIARLAAAGITAGCNPPDNDRFCPNRHVTRGQMAAFLTRALSLPASDTDWFADDTDSVFEAGINSLAEAGITRGCNPPDNDRFCPERAVSRAEMASFLARALSLDTPPVALRPYRIDVIPREEWGAATPTGAFASHEIDELTIHHSDDGGTSAGPQLYRAWQAWHQHLGWPDLAYHFIIGVDGTVYEGRPIGAVGDTATEYDPTGHLLIVVEGDFDHESPSPAQVESLSQMVAWASMYFDIPTITGHRDHASTTCPGDGLYALIDDGSLAARAQAIKAEGGVTLWVDGKGPAG